MLLLALRVNGRRVCLADTFRGSAVRAFPPVCNNYSCIWAQLLQLNRCDKQMQLLHIKRSNIVGAAL